MNKLVISNDEKYEDKDAITFIIKRDFNTAEELFSLISEGDFEEVEIYEVQNLYGLPNILDKIKFKKLKVLGKDLNLLVDFYYRNYINFSTLILNLYNGCTTMYSCNLVIEMLKDLNLQIQVAKIDGINYYIEAIRE